MSYTFKFAETAAEFEAVRRLNHDVFSAELGQHEPREDGLLIDRFESSSRYLIAVDEQKLVGMLCLRGSRPFSVEKRLTDVQVLEQLAQPVMEVRLLAVKTGHREKLALLGLLGELLRVARAENVGTLVISGVTSRLDLYRKMGFVDLGPAVPEGRTAFVRMAVAVRNLPDHVMHGFARYLRRKARA